MEKKRKITMQYIADVTGVSKATVSNALNGKDEMLAPEVKKRILQKAEELGYHKKHHLIRFIIFEKLDKIDPGKIDKNANFRKLYQSIKKECTENGYQLQINHIHEKEKEHGFQYINDLSDCDGMIILGWELALADLEWLRNYTSLPFVIVDASFSSLRFDFIASNNADASYRMTEEMILHGHKRIGYIHGGNPDVYRERMIGYQNALYAHHLEFDRHLVCELDRSAKSEFVEEIRAFLLKINKRNVPQPTAFICSDDRIAISFMAAAKALNLRYALSGFDNLSLCEEQDPPLSSVEINYSYTGTIAARRMIDKIEKKDMHTQKIYTETIIHIRESIFPKQN